ncbi:hypothetical protein JCM10212_002980 [Sporobolomyces blumeae]
MSMEHVTRRLLREAVPLVPVHGFTSTSLLVAGRDLDLDLDHRSLDALFPSPPVLRTRPNEFSLKGFAIGNGGKPSLSRDELVRLARGQGLDGPPDHQRPEPTGPARALVRAWLDHERVEMVRHVRRLERGGEHAMRRGVEQRLRSNLPVLDHLPDALALLSAPTTTPLSSPLSSLSPFPSPVPHFDHAFKIANDLAKASGSTEQGTAWYRVRMRLALIYTLSELHLLASASSPSSSPPPSSSSSSPSSSRSKTTTSTTTTPSSPTPSSSSSPSSSPSRSRTSTIDLEPTLEFSTRLFDESLRFERGVEGIGQFGEWVWKSWKGIGTSLTQ